MDFDAWLAGKGFDIATLTDTQRLSLQAAWRAEQNPAPAPAPAPAAGAGSTDNDLAAIMAGLKADQERQRQITALVAQAAHENPNRLEELEKIGRLAIDGKWDTQKTELALLRACRASAPAPLYSGPAQQVTGLVLEAAIAQAAGLKDAEAAYDERTLEAAHKQFRGGLGLQQLLLIAAQQNGYRGTAGVKANLQEVLRAAFGGYGYAPRADVAPSNVSISGILSNVANKFLREAFLAVEQAWRDIAAIRPVSDFKQITSYSLTGDMTYEEVAPGGELKHGTLGEASYTNQAKSYGKIIGLDRRDIINDDLGALNGVSRRLGRGGALKLNQVFWGVFLNNAGFFTAGNDNYLSGAGTALGVDALTAADEQFRTQTDPDGKLMGTIPAILLVPAALRVTALQLMNSVKLVTGDTAHVPENNPFAGAFKPVSSAYLQDSSLTGYSATGWYLLASPDDVPVIEVAFLNGVEVPTIESADMDFDRLGISLRGYHDFGVALQEYRGGQKNKGSV
jgi:hypothetical protein